VYVHIWYLHTPRYVRSTEVPHGTARKKKNYHAMYVGT
jgi:hypothetical protein